MLGYKQAEIHFKIKVKNVFLKVIVNVPRIVNCPLCIVNCEYISSRNVKHYSPRPILIESV